MIDCNRIHELVRVCLAGSEDNPNLIKVEGALRSYGFDSHALGKHKSEIVGYLTQLDGSFMKSGGGGMSLMNMVQTKDGELWGEQYTADELYVLAAGLGLASYCLPREFWSALPGSMPYIVINDDQFEVA